MTRDRPGTGGVPDDRYTEHGFDRPSRSSVSLEGKPTVSASRASLPLLIGITLTLSGCGPTRYESTSLLGPGEMLPTLQAEGWLNGPALSGETLTGRVIVIDCWAYW